MSYSKSATNPGLRGPLTDDASRGFSNHCLLLYPNKTVVSTHNVKRNMIKETEDKVFILQENFLGMFVGSFGTLSDFRISMSAV